MRLAKLYAFVFRQLRASFKGLYDDGYAEWKALVVVCCTELLVIMATVAAVEIGLQRRLLPTSELLFVLLASGLSLAVTAANYHALMAHKKWARFEAEFKQYSATTRIVGGIAVWVGILVIVVVTLAATAEVV